MSGIDCGANARSGAIDRSCRTGGGRSRVAALACAIAFAAPLLAAFPAGPALGAPAAPKAGTATGGDTLTVLFTAETRGNLVPCTCPGEKTGGLARRVGLLRQLAGTRAAGGTVLVLDAGGQLPDGTVPLRDSPETMERYVSLLLESMEAGGLTAAAIDHGERTFLLRYAPRQAGRLAPVLLEADPPSRPRVVRWGDRTIAILALEESLPDTTVLAAGRAARAAADFVLVLARAEAFTGRRLARLSGADLVLLSRGARPPELLREGESILAGCGVDGHELGEIRLVERRDAPNASRPALEPVSHRLHRLGAGTPEDAEIARRVTRLLGDAGPDAFLAPRE